MTLPLTTIGLVIFVVALAVQVHGLRSDVDRLKRQSMGADGATVTLPPGLLLPTGYCLLTNPPRCYP